MKKYYTLTRYLLIVVVLSFGFHASAQMGYNWAHRIGSGAPGDENVMELVTDASGNIYATGYFRGSVDFDPGAGTTVLSSVGAEDVFITKKSPSGALLWVKRLGASGSENAVDIDLDVLGNVYVLGSFFGTVDFDPGTGTVNVSATSPGNNLDCFVLKLDNSGNYISVANWGNSSDDRAKQLEIDNLGNIVVGCEFLGASLDADPGAGIQTLTAEPTAVATAYILKLSSALSFVWSGILYGPESLISSIDIDNSNDIYLAGGFSSTMDVDPGVGTANITATGLYDAYVMKWSSAGNYLWHTQAEGSGNEQSTTVLVHNSEVWVGGFYNANTDFNPTGTTILTATGGFDGFLWKLSTGGSFSSAKALTGVNNQSVEGLVKASDGSLYVCGYMTGVTDLDPGAGTASFSTGTYVNGFILKLNSSDNYQAAYGLLTNSSVAGSAGNYINTIRLDHMENILIGGKYQALTDFDIEATVNEMASQSVTYDGFVAKYTTCLAPASPAVINGSTTVCVSSSTTYSVAAVPSATSYTWTLPSGWSGSSTGTSINVTAGTTGGTINVTANGVCGASSAPTNLTVNVNDVPATPGIISGDNAVCASVSETYSIASVPTATSYSWIIPAGWTGTSTSESIVLQTGSSGGTLEVAAVNSCGSSSIATLSLTIIPVPDAPLTMNGNTSPCAGTIESYAVDPVSGATHYIWTAPGTWNGTSTINIIDFTVGSVSGTLEVSAANECGLSTPSILTVNVLTIPNSPASISGATTVCSGLSQVYSVANDPTVSSYNWGLPAGWTGSSFTNAITVTTSANGGEISVSATNVCGTSAPTDLIVTVSGTGTLPDPPTSISGAASICANSLNSYEISPVNGATSYNWLLPFGWTGASTTTNIDVQAANNSGTIEVSAINDCGASAPATFSVSVTDIDSSVTLNGTVLTAVQNGATYQWLDCGNGNAPINGATSSSFTPVVNGSYAVAITLNGCTEVSECTQISTIGLEETLREAIVLYPNPTAGNITILSNTIIQDITIVNTLGEQMLSQTGIKTIQTDMTLSLQPGMYFALINFSPERSVVVPFVLR